MTFSASTRLSGHSPAPRQPSGNSSTASSPAPLPQPMSPRRLEPLPSLMAARHQQRRPKISRPSRVIRPTPSLRPARDGAQGICHPGLSTQANNLRRRSLRAIACPFDPHWPRCLPSTTFRSGLPTRDPSQRRGGVQPHHLTGSWNGIPQPLDARSPTSPRQRYRKLSYERDIDPTLMTGYGADWAALCAGRVKTQVATGTFRPQLP
jgi:hypothetical protein